MRVTGYNSIQNINYNKNNANKSTNFKALIMEPNIKSQLSSRFHGVVQRLQSYSDYMNTFRFWDLKVLSKNNEPIFILKSKKYNNQYFLPPINV